MARSRCPRVTRSGFLEQEPHLDNDKTVREVVQEAVQPIVDLLARYDAVNEAFGDPDADFDALIAEQAALQEEIERRDAWELDNHLEVAMEALAVLRPIRRCASSQVVSGGAWR